MMPPDTTINPLSALEAAGLEPPPASPFDAPPAAAPAPPEPQLNRAQRRSVRHNALADVRLMARVVRWDLARPRAGAADAPAYPSELAATYGLERAAKAMRLKGLLTRSEQARLQSLARYRRAALKVKPAC